MDREVRVKTCPNCGWSNEDQNRFCENCGADFSGLERQGQPPTEPLSTWRTPSMSGSQPSSPSPWEVPPGSPDWRMAPLPPEEAVATRGRRVWLWLLVGVLTVCVVTCAVSVYWLEYTESGRDFQTEMAERATETSE
jgi:hypothetical protein